MDQKNKVCAVVVTFNRLDMLKDAINALKNQDYPCDILVVNNGSTDGTKEYLNNTKGIKVIHQENVGGAGGFYTGMKYACESGYEFAWVMDDDVKPYPDALEALMNVYQSQSRIEKIGFLCSMVLNPEGNPANVPAINKRRSESGHAQWNNYLYKGIVGVSSATFVSVLIPVSVIREVGLPYREFFIWGDDTEYTNRISMRYPCYLVGNSYVTHFRTEAIDLIKLKDKNRIKMYVYSVRNNWFNNKQDYYDSKEKLTNYLWHVSIIGRLVAKGEFKKALVIVKGIYMGINFKPTLEFPDTKIDK